MLKGRLRRSASLRPLPRPPPLFPAVRLAKGVKRAVHACPPHQADLRRNCLGVAARSRVLLRPSLSPSISTSSCQQTRSSAQSIDAYLHPHSMKAATIASVAILFGGSLVLAPLNGRFSLTGVPAASLVTASPLARRDAAQIQASVTRLAGEATTAAEGTGACAAPCSAWLKASTASVLLHPVRIVSRLTTRFSADLHAERKRRPGQDRLMRLRVVGALRHVDLRDLPW